MERMKKTHSQDKTKTNHLPQLRFSNFAKKALCGIFDKRFIYIVDSNTSELFLSMINDVEKDIINGEIHKKIITAHRFTLNNLTESRVVEETIRIYRDTQNAHIDIRNPNILRKHSDWIAR